MKFYNSEGYITGCFTVFESLIIGCKTEEEFISRKEEFYQIIKKTAHETKLEKDIVDYLWSRLKVMIENKRKELFEKNKNWNRDAFNVDDLWEKIRKQSRSNSYEWFGGFDSGFDPSFKSHGQNNYSNNFKGFGFKNTSQNIEISFKYFDLTKTANEEQLIKAYRIKSLKTHPDKPGGSKQLFQECSDHKEKCLNFIKRGY